MHQSMTATWEKVLRPALREEAGIDVCDYDQLDSDQREALHEHFQKEIYPILTPLTVDPGHPFPFISNLSVSLAVILEHPKQGTTHFVRLKTPPRRWLRVPASEVELILRLLRVEQLIAQHADELFPGMIDKNRRAGDEHLHLRQLLEEKTIQLSHQRSRSWRQRLKRSNQGS